ncbi:MAG: hypothetical protein IJQ84_02690 [Paludibacteraceae bacterium]|nr:hypothetical protein [Paludibacteraceae bacterium]
MKTYIIPCTAIIELSASLMQAQTGSSQNTELGINGNTSELGPGTVVAF